MQTGSYLRCYEVKDDGARCKNLLPCHIHTYHSMFKESEPRSESQRQFTETYSESDGRRLKMKRLCVAYRNKTEGTIDLGATAIHIGSTTTLQDLNLKRQIDTRRNILSRIWTDLHGYGGVANPGTPDDANLAKSVEKLVNDMEYNQVDEGGQPDEHPNRMIVSRSIVKSIFQGRRERYLTFENLKIQHEKLIALVRTSMDVDERRRSLAVIQRQKEQINDLNLKVSQLVADQRRRLEADIITNSARVADQRRLRDANIAANSVYSDERRLLRDATNLEKLNLVLNLLPPPATDVAEVLKLVRPLTGGGYDVYKETLLGMGRYTMHNLEGYQIVSGEEDAVACHFITELFTAPDGYNPQLAVGLTSLLKRWNRRFETQRLAEQVPFFKVR